WNQESGSASICRLRQFLSEEFAFPAPWLSLFRSAPTVVRRAAREHKKAVSAAPPSLPSRPGGERVSTSYWASRRRSAGNQTPCRSQAETAACGDRAESAA